MQAEKFWNRLTIFETFSPSLGFFLKWNLSALTLDMILSLCKVQMGLALICKMRRSPELVFKHHIYLVFK